MLVLSRFFFAFRLLKTVFAVVDDLADGRRCLRSDLNQIKVHLSRFLQRLNRRHKAKLVAVGSNHPNLPVADLLVDLMFSAANSEAPPKHVVNNK